MIGESFLKWIIVILQGATLAVVTAGVFWRYVLNDPLPFTEELARFTMIWAAFLACYFASKEGAHIGITILVDSLRPGLSKLTIFISHIFVLVFLGLVIWFGIRFCLDMSDHSTPTLAISFGLVYLAVPLSACLMLVDYLKKLVGNLKQ